MLRCLKMSTWNAIYFRGSIPDGFRPSVEGTCPARRVTEWVEVALPGVEDGEATALALSSRVSGHVIWAYVQTTASCVGVMHCTKGELVRAIEFGDGSWHRDGRVGPVVRPQATDP